MQAQAPHHAEWAIGVRSSGLTRARVRDEFQQGQIVRTWAMRGTLHAVPARDAAWMLTHLGVRQVPGIRTQLLRSGLDTTQVEAGIEALADALDRGRLSKSGGQEVVAAVVPGVTSQQITHLLYLAAHLGIACPGPDPATGGQTHYVRLASVVSDPVALDRAEAYRVIAERYIRSHGPVTAADLARWAGITLTDARRAIAGLGDRLVSATWGEETVHLTRDLADSRLGHGVRVHLLPAFDGHVIGYASRQPVVPADHDHEIVPGRNGIYRPTIARDGGTVGTWTTTREGLVDRSMFSADDHLVIAPAESEWRRFDADGG